MNLIKLPVGQKIQEIEPGTDVSPFGQRLHALRDFPPMVALNVPIGQGRHKSLPEIPEIALYVPLGQGLHNLALFAAEYVPGGHSTQDDPLKNDPALQLFCAQNTTGKITQ